MKLNYRLCILSFVILSFLAFNALQAQDINSDILERLKEEQKITEEERETDIKRKEEISREFQPESLSTIEKTFKNNYFVNRERREMEHRLDSLISAAKMESLKISIRTKYPPEYIERYTYMRDTVYYKLKTQIEKFKKHLDTTTVNLKQYGYDMFSMLPSDISSYHPVSQNYVMGPGDELQIQLSGQINESWSSTIDREGKLILPSVGSVTLWGYEYNEAKKIIKEAINREFSNVRIDISLGNLRGVNVYVLGEVRKPGRYSMSAISDPLSAIFTAGGLRKSGSLRKIKYISKSGTRKQFDIYELLIEGKRLNPIQLESGDIIYIPPIGDVVGVTGSVKRPAIYEITPEENISDLLNMAGGILPTGGTHRIQLERVKNGRKKIVEDFEIEDEDKFYSKLSGLSVKKGDLLEIFEISPIRHNNVEIKGNIEIPGTYELKHGMTVLDLISKAGGIKEGTYLKRAEILRYRGLEKPEIIEFNLNRLLRGDSTENYLLKEWDILQIFSSRDIMEMDSVSVTGEVQNPGKYPLNPDMKLGDLIFIGNPLKTSYNMAELFRTIPGEGVKIEDINLNDSSFYDKKLMDNDQLIIRKKPTFRDIGKVHLIGEFQYPGMYPIRGGEKLKNVVERAGGFTDEAYLDGAIFTRKSVAKLQNQAVLDLIRETKMDLMNEQRQLLAEASAGDEKSAMMEYLSQQQREIENLSKIKKPGRVVINLNNPAQLSIPLEDGDSLYVPRLKMTVQIVGDVYNPTGVSYQEDLSVEDYIKMSGGPKPTADVKRIYVRRASGQTVRDPEKLKPGDTIIVPEKIEIGKSVWEILGNVATIVYQIGVGIAAAYAVFGN